MDCLLDAPYEIIETVSEVAETVEAEEGETLTFKAVVHLVVEVGAGVSVVQGIDPKDGSRTVAVKGDVEAWRMGVVASDDGGGNHLGVMVGVACFPASEIGAAVLADDGLSVYGNECLGEEFINRGVGVDDGILPRVGVVVVLSIMENVHDGVILL